ncbi:MAG: hypothetical protein FWC42_05285 [Proteobacteria bacterium]|nr:hypothetical protein [Pseudomonadota bacterium]
MISSSTFQKRFSPGALAFIGLFFLALTGLGCSPSDGAAKKTESAAKKTESVAEKTESADTGFKTLSAEDKTNQLKVKIKVPTDWKSRNDLNDDAVIQASNKADTLFLVVISEPKDQFDQGTKLEDYADIVIQNYLEKTEGQSSEKPIKTTVNGRPALQYEIERKMNKIVSVKLYFVVIKGVEGFHQVLVWTLSSNWEKKQAELKSIVNSFQEV